MKAPVEIKQWINRMRRGHGGNGVLPAFCFDQPKMEVKIAKNKRIVRRGIRIEE